jgi:hypothetical protein
MRELKRAIHFLVEARHGGLTTARAALRTAGLMALVCAVGIPIMLAIQEGSRAVMGLAPASYPTKGVRFVVTAAAVLFAIAGVAWREWYRDWSGVRRAIAFARDVERDRTAPAPSPQLRRDVPGNSAATGRQSRRGLH